MEYKDFLKQKQKSHILSGFDIETSKLNNSMFDLAKANVKMAVVAKQQLSLL